ncbi:hypothetical protein GCM10022380_03360 [Amycolatopsis tucumanensis]|uniref:Uncharacterized protein n=1 Tax=Amycolatopsis tucumanensis TaxID=401106 RepID=A0ABP7HEQ4_9PSEU
MEMVEAAGCDAAAAQPEGGAGTQRRVDVADTAAADPLAAVEAANPAAPSSRCRVTYLKDLQDWRWMRRNTHSGRRSSPQPT